MLERDERPLSEIRFAQDLPIPQRDRMELEIRRKLSCASVSCAQDIIDLGCTGLVMRLSRNMPEFEAVEALQYAQDIRANMAGSVCGLPCYVPDTRFCLVHNTVGGLQLSGNKDGPQLNPYPEGLELCSRELTVEEVAKMRGVHAFIQDQGAKEVAEHFNAEVISEDTEAHFDFETKEVTTPAVVALASFTCPEHSEFISGCRFCLAQSIVDGPLEPQLRIHAEYSDSHSIESADASLLSDLLTSDVISVEMYVLAARWSRKLTKE